MNALRTAAAAAAFTAMMTMGTIASDTRQTSGSSAAAPSHYQPASRPDDSSEQSRDLPVGLLIPDRDVRETMPFLSDLG